LEEHPVKFGVILPNFSGLGTRDVMVEIAQEAEALGYDSIWTTDHVMMAKGYEEPYGRILEALTTLTYLAPLTSKVSLGASVVVLPQRNPIVVAKEAATLDYLSGGRLILGVGAGWNEREFRFLGASFPDRGPRLDEYIRVLRELWTSPDPHFEGQYVAFSDALFAPRPVQPNGPPIVIGGGSPPALRRAARLADGWHSVGIPPAEYARGMQTITKLAQGRAIEGSLRIRTAVGRVLPEYRGAQGRKAWENLSGSSDQVIAKIKEYQAAGVSHLVCHFGNDDRESFLGDMRRFVADVRPAVSTS
jgi:probable F420-dependent oxidoreductase